MLVYYIIIFFILNIFTYYIDKYKRIINSVRPGPEATATTHMYICNYIRVIATFIKDLNKPLMVVLVIYYSSTERRSNFKNKHTA